MSALLAVARLEAFYGASQILHGIDLSVARGEQVALIGRNLTDQRILQTGSAMPLATTITGGAGNAYNGIVDRPRTIAVQVTGRF